jgi:hypothetical protein
MADHADQNTNRYLYEQRSDADYLSPPNMKISYELLPKRKNPDSATLIMDRRRVRRSSRPSQRGECHKKRGYLIGKALGCREAESSLRSETGTPQLWVAYPRRFDLS